MYSGRSHSRARGGFPQMPAEHEARCYYNDEGAGFHCSREQLRTAAPLHPTPLQNRKKHQNGNRDDFDT